MKTCWGCAHLHFDAGTQGYSQWTPGEPAQLFCDHMVWRIRFAESQDSVAEKIRTAETCGLFKERET